MSEYRTPFITKTDERTFNDCQSCSGLMLVADWTDGEAVHDEHGNTHEAAGLKALRERIRTLSGDTVGGATLDAFALAIARRFPDLPPLPRSTAPANPLTLTFDELWAKLGDGHPMSHTWTRPLRGAAAHISRAADRGTTPLTYAVASIRTSEAPA